MSRTLQLFFFWWFPFYHFDIDGLRKAGDAPGHKIVVAVCVCVFVVVVVVVMLGSSLWGRKWSSFLPHMEAGNDQTMVKQTKIMFSRDRFIFWGEVILEVWFCILGFKNKKNEKKTEKTTKKEETAHCLQGLILFYHRAKGPVYRGNSRKLFSAHFWSLFHIFKKQTCMSRNLKKKCDFHFITLIFCSLRWWIWILFIFHFSILTDLRGKTDRLPKKKLRAHCLDFGFWISDFGFCIRYFQTTPTRAGGFETTKILPRNTKCQVILKLSLFNRKHWRNQKHWSFVHPPALRY